MDQIPNWLNSIVTITGALGTLVTAIATFFLWRVTKTLAHETTRMAEASAQPHVVATFKPNRWTLNHFDIHIDNTGNATAYDVIIKFDPPINNGEARNPEGKIPFQQISVINPEQGLSSYICEFEKLKNKIFQVEISWKRDASKEQRQSNSYTIDMTDHEGISKLGDDPLVEISRHIKKLQEDWRPIANGSKRTNTNIYSSFDRLHEQRVSLRQRRRILASRQSQSDTTRSSSDLDIPQ